MQRFPNLIINQVLSESPIIIITSNSWILIHVIIINQILLHQNQTILIIISNQSIASNNKLIASNNDSKASVNNKSQVS